MMANRSMPESTVVPELAYPNVEEGVDHLARTFGFQLRIRIGDHRAQLKVGEGDVVLTRDTQAALRRASVLVRVDDIDAHYKRACASGLRIVTPPTDYPYGERQYRAEDFAGHQWCFSQSVADVDPKDWGGALDEGEPKVMFHVERCLGSS